MICYLIYSFRNLIRREVMLESFGVLNPVVVLIVFLDFPDQYHVFVCTSSPM